MTTKNPIINVTFEEATVSILAILAEEKHKSVANLVYELSLEPIKIREDFYLSKVTEKININKSPT